MRLRIIISAICLALVGGSLVAGCASVPGPGPAVPTAGTPPAPASPQVTAPAEGLPSPDAMTPAAPITITYWEEDADAAGVVLDELAAGYMQANPGIKVQRVHYTYEDLRGQFRDVSRSLVEGEPPDLVRGPGEYSGPFSELGIIHPADAFLSREYLDQYLPGALDGVTVRGRIWGVPDDFGNHLMLFYNRGLVQEPPADTEAWITQLKGLTDTANGQYGLVFAAEESYWLIPWLSGYGGWPLDAGDKPALDTAEMIEALWFIHDLKYAHLVMPPSSNYNESFRLFSEGKAAYIIDGRWNLDSYRQVGIDAGIATLPRVKATGIVPASMATGRYWYLAKGLDGERLAAALNFVEYMTSPASQIAWLSRLGRLPANREAVEGPSITGDPQLEPIVAQLKLARGVPPALEMACAWRGIDSQLRDVIRGAVSPDKAAPAMQAVADVCMAEIALDPTPSPTP